jgi:hypothetical protein
MKLNFRNIVIIYSVNRGVLTSTILLLWFFSFTVVLGAQVENDLDKMKLLSDMPEKIEETLRLPETPIETEDEVHDLRERRSGGFPGFLKSALIPGWGELSMSNKSGYAFLAMELLLWSSHFFFLSEVKLREEEAYIYALQNAGINPGNRDEEYLVLLGKYNSSGFEPGGYNEMVYRRAKSLFSDPYEQDQYIAENAISEESLFWNWESREHRRDYSIMRKNADHNRDYAKAVVGAIVANHLISMINSVRIGVTRRRAERVNFGVKFDRERETPLLQTEISF